MHVWSHRNGSGVNGNGGGIGGVNVNGGGNVNGNGGDYLFVRSGVGSDSE